jgi:hypothetical protein
LVYGLLPNKQEDTYSRFLAALKNVSNTAANVELNPETVLTDFEQGCINAFNDNFPNTARRGVIFTIRSASGEKFRSAQIFWKSTTATQILI